jgi:hypothetical protein
VLTREEYLASHISSGGHVLRVKRSSVRVPLLRKITAAVVALGVTAAIVVVPEAIVAASPVHAPRKTALPVHPRSTRAQRLGIPRATESWASPRIVEALV